MLYEVIFVVLLSLSAVYGIYCAVRVMVAWITATRIQIAVVLEPFEDAEALRMKIVEAKNNSYGNRTDVFVLIPIERADDHEIDMMLSRYNVRRFLTVEK